MTFGLDPADWYGRVVESTVSRTEFLNRSASLVSTLLTKVPFHTDPSEFFDEMMFHFVENEWVDVCDRCFSSRAKPDRFPCAGCGHVPADVDDESEDS